MSRVELLTIVLFIWTSGACLSAPQNSWTLHNPTKTEYRDELVRVGIPLPDDFDANASTLLQDGKPVPFDVWTVDGKRTLLVATTIAPGASHTFELKPGTPAPSSGAIHLSIRDGEATIIGNGLISLRLPGGVSNGLAPPLLGVSIGTAAEATWIGQSELRCAAALRSRKTTVGTGKVAGLARVEYEFDVPGATKPARYALDVTIPPGKPFAIVRESFDGLPASSEWVFDLAAGWSPKHVAVQLNNDANGPGSGGISREKWPKTLATGQTRMGDTLVNLLPRWSQSFDDGWFFATHDGSRMVGVLPARAGQWLWPHDNKIRVQVKSGADFAGLRLPIARGARYWLLLAGTVDLVGKERDLAVRETMSNLDKIVHEYITDWPGMTRGSFDPVFFFAADTNPTGARRQQGRNALRDGMSGVKGDLSTLFRAQQNLDPDWYGRYGQFWSPQNPNFFTDFHKVTLGLVAQLRDHPRFEELRARAEAVFREDLDHSVTLPGGAGQECPGYLAHAAEQWLAMLPLCKERLGFDPSAWPRWRAVGQFILHSSQPIGGGKRAFHPGGDTHPGRPDPLEFAARFGYRADPKSFVTEELPGFGVIFRNRAGTDRETYLAFKAGPNRGHYHGDQLSFHFCADARPLVVDHHCSYKPRAGQEHMHNRVAFSTPKLPFANMDGYERLIAFKTSPFADLAVAQVESDRLRGMRELPPEEWDARLPEERLARPLVYRRTIVLLKAERDVIVIRDQFWGPKVNAHYHLHPLGNRCERNGAWIRADGLDLFVAEPQRFDFAPFSWEHDNGGHEKTTGPRLTITGESGQFITALFTGGRPREGVKAVAGGLTIGNLEILFDDVVGDRSSGPVMQDQAEVTIRQNGKPVMTLQAAEIDFDRSQGAIGLFVPDAGYPFGPLPDWLIRQRASFSRQER